MMNVLNFSLISLLFIYFLFFISFFFLFRVQIFEHKTRLTGGRGEATERSGAVGVRRLMIDSCVWTVWISHLSVSGVVGNKLCTLKSIDYSKSDDICSDDMQIPSSISIIGDVISGGWHHMAFGARVLNSNGTATYRIVFFSFLSISRLTHDFT